MGREYALIHSVERNHRLRARPCAPPPAEPPDRPGRRVRFADPPVTGSKTDNTASRPGHEAGPKVSASAKGDGVYVSRVSAPAPSAVEKLTSVSRRQHGEGSPSGGGDAVRELCDRGRGPDSLEHVPLQSAPLNGASARGTAGDVSEPGGWHRGPGCLDPTYTLSPGLAVRRLPVQAAPSRESQANARDNDRAAAAAARRPSEAADSATLNPRGYLLGRPAAGLARSPRGGQPCDPERPLLEEIGVPGRVEGGRNRDYEARPDCPGRVEGGRDRDYEARPEGDLSPRKPRGSTERVQPTEGRRGADVTRGVRVRCLGRAY